MVSGPTQNSRDAVSHPSMNRSRAAESVPPSVRQRRATQRLDAPGEPLQPVLDAQCRAGDGPDQQRPQHDEQGEAGADRVAQGGVGDGDGRQTRHEERDQAQHVGDDRAGVLAQAVPDQHPQTEPR